MIEDRVQADVLNLDYLLKEKAHLEVKLFKVNTAIALVRKREEADQEARAFRNAEGI